MKFTKTNSDSASWVIGQLAGEVTSALRQGQPLSLEGLQAKFTDSEVDVDVAGFAQTLTLLEEAAFQRCSRHHAPGVIDDTGRRRKSLGGFKLIREISRGGMGIVYEATQDALNRRVAIKVLPPSPLLTEAERERFRREGRAAAKLHHEHIVPVFATGSEHGILYCVMQLIDGYSLDEILSFSRKQRDTLQLSDHTSDGPSLSGLRSLVRQLGITSDPLEPDTATVDDPLEDNQPRTSCEASTRWQRIATIGTNLAGALQHAHQQQVLHRDIKPGNVLLGRDGRPWLADFGLARLRDCSKLTEAGGWLGTLRYCAPEQLDGKADERSDVYALGITLYELCTLEPAFPASDRTELVHDLLHTTPKPPRELVPEIPRDLETILLKAISREPGDRYSTADQLRLDLQRFLNDRPPAARRYGRMELAWRWCRRNRREASLIFLLVLTFFAFTFTTTLAYVREARLRASADQIAATAHSALDRVYEAYLPEFSESLLGQASGSLPVSTEAAELLEQLASFYDQLQGYSEQSSYRDENLNGFLKSEAAIRRVALIYLRLGEFEKSRQLLARSSEQLFYLIQERPNPEVLLEYVRVRNDLAAVDWLNRPVWTNRSIDNMDEELQMTLRYLNKYSPTNAEIASTTQKDISYEKARTLYLLGRSIRRQSKGSLHHRDIPAIKFEVPSDKNLQILSEAVTLLEQLRCDNPQEVRYRFLQALCLIEQVAGTVDISGNANESKLLQAIEQLQTLAHEHPTHPAFRCSLSLALRRLSLPTQLADSAYDVLLERSQRAIDLSNRLVQDHPGEWIYVVSLLESYQLRLHVQRRFKRFDEALTSWQDAVQVCQASLENEPEDGSIRFCAGYILLRKSELLKSLRQTEQELETSIQALAYFEPDLARDSPRYPLALRFTRRMANACIRASRELNRSSETEVYRTLIARCDQLNADLAISLEVWK